MAQAPPPLPPAPVDPPVTVVGIGASAGGLEALERLFETMPEQTGLAFVVIQHLSPDFKSLTDELLARRTSIPIFRVENGMELRRDAIFLLPPRKDMLLQNGKLLLTDKDSTRYIAMPIDRFFRSLADEMGEHAVGIVLSGTGSDGSRGIREIHDAGGLVIAQSPESAKFDGMPRSALETGTVHLTLAPEQIPDALLRHISHPRAPALTAGATEDLPAGLQAILRLLRETCGIDFTHYKPDTVARRIERRLLLNQGVGIDAYARRLVTDPEELNLLYRDLLIGVTRFFRDEEAFESLRRDVLPGLLDRLSPDEELRLWVAGCATGEEAYSLAILIREALDDRPRAGPVKIFATDAHRMSIDIASQGEYGKNSLASLPPARLERFFTRRGEKLQVTPELRKMVVFAQHNLIKDAPFTKLDLVTCRNLLIYLLPQVQKKVLSLFHFGLRTGGALFLGPSESPGDLSDEFEVIDQRWKVYRKHRDVRLAPDFRMPLGTHRPRPAGQPGEGAAGSVNVLSEARDTLLEQFLPPSLLVNEARHVVQTFAGGGNFLRVRDGRFTGDVLDMVADELRMALSGAMPRVLKEMTPVVYKALRVEMDGVSRLLDVTVRPVRGSRSSPGHLLISFEGAEAAAQPPPREMDLDEASLDRFGALEAELRHTKENLQAMIEEMETSNEELQATNEELVAANEELQSTNEELHSVNEELHTVNAEYQNKIAQLTELTTDMDNLLTSTEVHTIFLDRNLCIRRFTPKIAETFNLMPQDTGRRIDNFTYTFDYPGLLADLEAVRGGADPLERQVRDRRGNWFLLRVLPYRAGLHVAGVVLTLIDFNGVKAAEALARQKDEQLRSILRNLPNWVFIRDRHGRYVLCGESFQKAFGPDPVGKTPTDLFKADVAAVLTRDDDRVLEEGAEEHAEVEVPGPDGPHSYLSVKFPVCDEEGKIVGVGGIMTDVTGMKDAEREAREAVGQRDRFLAMLSHELRNPLAAILNATYALERTGSLPPECRAGLGVIERRTRHMARLVDDLLDVARVTQNKVEVRKSIFDLAKVTPELLEGVRPWFEERQVVLLAEVPNGPLLVEGDPDRLQQIQINLLMNAVKYTPAGGTVRYSVDRDDRSIVVCVRDTGVGLSREMLGRVFDLFVQADEALDRAGGGIGVGLTLVKTIVELHGGTVEVRSEGPGKGSEFVVRLPAAGELPAPVVAPVGGDDQTDGRGRRVLLVEDDQDIRESLRVLLELDGFHVRAVGDGEEALAAFASDPPFAAVIDLGLPRMTGFELARRLRDLKSPDQLVLLAVTGYGQMGDRRAALEAGFDDHLTKPIRPSELSRRLASLAPGGEPDVPSARQSAAGG